MPLIETPPDVEPRRIKDEAKRRIVVFGAAHPDTILSVTGHFTPDQSHTVAMTRDFGGTGLRLATSIVKMGFFHPLLLTAFGLDTVKGLMDRYGDQLNIEYVANVFPNENTASFTVFRDLDGKLRTGGLAHGTVYEKVDGNMLRQNKGKLNVADTWVTDSAFTRNFYEAFVQLAIEGKKQVFAVISDKASAKNLMPLLNGFDGLAGVIGSIDEIIELAGNLDRSVNYDRTPAGINRALHILKSHGAKSVLATDGTQGVHALFEGQFLAEFFTAPEVQKENKLCHSGLGDAFAGAFIASIMQGYTQEQAISIGQRIQALRQEGKDSEANIKRFIATMHELQLKNNSKTQPIFS